MKKMMLLIWLSLLSVGHSSASAGWRGPAGPKTYYVNVQDPNASDANDGLSPNWDSEAGSGPFKTIGQAMSVVEPGDVAYVRAGLYEESNLRFSHSGEEGAPITLSAYPTDNGFEDVAIDGLGGTDDVNGITIAGSQDFIVLQGVEIRNMPNVGIAADGYDHRLGHPARLGLPNPSYNRWIWQSSGSKPMPNVGIATGESARHRGIVIKDVVVRGNRIGIALTSTDASELESVETFDNAEEGIRLEAANNGSIANSNAHHNTVGFSLVSSSNNLLEHNTATENFVTGFFLGSESNDNTLRDNLASDNQAEDGFTVSMGAGNVLVDNEAYGNRKRGFQLTDQSTHNLVENNLAHNNGVLGFAIYVDSTANTLRANTSHGNVFHGFVFLAGASNNLVEDNVSFGNIRCGFYFEAASSNEFRGNDAHENGFDGFTMFLGSAGNLFQGNTADRNGGWGFLSDYESPNGDLGAGNSANANGAGEFGEVDFESVDFAAYTDISNPYPDANQSTGQFEVTQSPITITLEAAQATDIRLGVLALDKMVAPAVNDYSLAAELPTDSVLLVLPDGTASFAYSDLFLRNFRGREQLITPGEDVENLLDLPDGYPKPKVLLDVHQLNVEGLVFNASEDILWWAGEITYKFDLGLPVTAFRLAGADGRRKTVVGDPAWEEQGRGVEILTSNDGETWTAIWRSHGKGEVTEVDAELPPSLLGQPTVYLKFRGQEHALVEFQVSASLDARELTPLLHLEAGRNDLEFTDAGNSSHKAVIFWEGRGIRGSMPDENQFNYPISQPQVVETDEAIAILFPQQVGITLRRTEGNGIAGIQNLLVGQRAVLSAPPVAMPPPTLDILSSGEVGGVTDWAAYLAEREAINEGKPADEWIWPKRGGREVHTLGLDGGEYLGYRLEEGSVVVRTQVSDGGETAEMEWVLSPVGMDLGGRDYRGLGWKVRLSGLEGATSLRIIEPAPVRYGDWTFAQVWGNFIESRLDFSAQFGVPLGTYFGDTQPFYFAGGPSGAVASFFDTPVAAQVAVAEEAGRHLLNLRTPLGAGSVRETPLKIWLWTDDAFPTKWDALDEWTAVYNATADRYRSSLGLGVTEPQPALLANWPTEEYMQRYWENGPPEYEDSFHYSFAHTKLQAAAELGFRVLIFDMHWDTDALYLNTPERYLPGSLSFGSGNAPWRLEINVALGGERALRELADRAHELGVKIILWIPPDHLSNSSPLLQEHPEWIKWRSDGTPETAGYGDITGTSLSSGWYDYAIAQYRSIQQATGFDGVLVDSWLTFAMLPDGSEAQPMPQLDQAMALQRDLRQMGITEIHIEGTSPFGLSSGGYGLEGYLGGGPEDQAMAVKLFERIQGREYGLYRYVADTIPEAGSYYRALASKGVIGVFNLDVLDMMPQDQLARIVQANHDYLRVSDTMERRHLIAEGDTWQGVAWTRRGSREEALFAFDRFRYPLAGRATIEDVTAGTRLSAEGGFETTPMHTYVITRCPDFVDPVGVGVEDIRAIAGHWGEQSTDTEWDPRFDLDHNQRVDLADVMSVVAALGNTCAPAGG